jgi:DNA-binding SARP family transcriptional activator/tetratricopeptide (TPR) repeat protein
VTRPQCGASDYFPATLRLRYRWMPGIAWLSTGRPLEIGQLMTASEPDDMDTSGSFAHQRGDDSGIQVRLLGPLLVSVGTRTLSLGSARVCKLLALLAANSNSVVPFDRIADVLWDDPPSSARQQVYNVVASLRRSLGEAAMQLKAVPGGVGYQLSVPESAIDIFRFRTGVQRAERAEADGCLGEAIGSLKRALDEWRGLAFTGLSSRQLQNMATVLSEQKLAAVEHLAELQLRQGDWDAPVSDLTELVAEYPFRESLRALLMEALHRSGRQVDALTVFEEGRRLLADELGLDPGTQLRAAQQLVFTDSSDAEGDTHGPVTLRGLPPKRGTGQRFLPRDILEFTGRDDEIRQLVASVVRAGTTALIISAIDGMGGVGKTTLAVHLAHKLAEQYPDGQYFVDLQGFSAADEPLAPLEALNVLLRSSGTPPELIPPDLGSRSALWRSSMAGQRFLLLLDNVADVAQVRPLLPGTPGSIVLITSRRRMPSLEGAVRLSIDVLPHADALSLFGQIVGPDRAAAEPDAAAIAIELCGRLPLAIQIAAARLRDRPSWSVAYLAERLRAAQSRSHVLAAGDRDVMGILAWSYRYLTPRQQMVFRLLSLHPGTDFDAWTAAALAGLSIDEAAVCLEELFDVNLLQQHAPGRYHFHDLVRDCSKERLDQHGDDAEQTSARRRVLDYYLRSANLWCKLLGKTAFHLEQDVVYEPRAVKRPETSGAAVELLDAEYRNVVAVTGLAASLGFHAHVWQLTCSLLPYFAYLNYGPEAETLLEQALRSARADSSLPAESACLTGLSHAMYARGQNAEAREVAVQAIELSRKNGDVAMEVFQRTGLGAMYWQDNLIEDAQEIFTETLEMAQKIGDQQAEGALVSNLGVITCQLGRFDDALRYYRRALALCQGTDELELHVHVLNNIGTLLSLQGKPSESAVQFENALRMSRDTAYRRGEVEAIIGICCVRRQMRDYDESIQCGRKALEMARMSSIYDAEGDALNALIDTFLALKDIDKAEEICLQASELAARYKSARYTARANEARAHIASYRGDIEAARRHWEQALSSRSGGASDPMGASRHLAAPGYGAEFCWRCNAPAPSHAL